MSKFDDYLLNEEQRRRIRDTQDGFMNAQRSNDEALMRSYHTRAEEVRREAGYSGESNGAGYMPVETFKPVKLPQIDEYQSQWENDLNFYLSKLQNPDEYVSKYTDKIETLISMFDVGKDYIPKYQKYIDQGIQDMIHRTPFQYTPDTDPVYQNYLTRVKGVAQKSYEQSVAGFADMSGGYVSSWAESSAKQAMDVMNQQAEQAIAGFEDLAYGKYKFETDDIYRRLNTVVGLENQSIDQFNKSQDNKINFINTLNKLDEREYLRFRDTVNDYKKMAEMVLELDVRDFEKYKFNVEQSWRKVKEEINIAKTELQWKQQEFAQAIERTELSGYVNNQDSILLQVPVGTPSKSARERAREVEFFFTKAERTFNDELKKMAIAHDYEMAITEMKNSFEMQKATLREDYADREHSLRESIQNAKKQAMGIEGEVDEEYMKAKIGSLSKSSITKGESWLKDIQKEMKTQKFQLMSKDEQYQFIMDKKKELAELSKSDVWGKDTFYIASYVDDKFNQLSEYKDSMVHRGYADREEELFAEYANLPFTSFYNKTDFNSFNSAIDYGMRSAFERKRVENEVLKSIEPRYSSEHSTMKKEVDSIVKDYKSSSKSFNNDTADLENRIRNSLNSRGK